jgi:hypothetical protein
MANGPTDAEVTEAVFVRDENPEDIESLYKDILNKASPEQLSRSNKKLASAEEAERSRKKKEPEGGRRNYDHSKDFLDRNFERPDEPSSGRNMGGMVEDELGYERGGMSYSDRGPVKYSKGGAVSGKNFKGSF